MSVIEAPSLDRPRVLMYLLSSTGKLQSDSIESLGAEFKTDTESGNFRSVADIAREISGDRSLFKKDPFLNHVALNYTLEELSVEYDPNQPLLPRSDGQPHALLDSLVGGGPARPVLFDLYSLEGLVGLATTEYRDESDVFYPTSKAIAHTKTLRLIFNRLEPAIKRSKALVVVEQYDQRISTN